MGFSARVHPQNSIVLLLKDKATCRKEIVAAQIPFPANLIAEIKCVCC
jgi:hypothetical protein